MSGDLKAIELLFQRPLEPVFTSRDNGKSAFDLPDSYYTERYSGVKVELQSRYGDDVENRIPMRDLISKPNLDFTKKLPKKAQFSLFRPQHQEIARQLIEMFLSVPDIEGFSSLCVYTKDRVNAMLFQYCFAVACQHRPDTRNVVVPPVAEVFPSSFVEPSVFQDARAEGSLITNPGERVHVEIPRNYTASDREVEQRLAYFREDIGVNMHHWHWHLVYPGYGPENVVRKDRRGELFYYMHNQIIARYNLERFCNNLAKVKPLSNLREPIPEGYFPKILHSSTNRSFPARIANQYLHDLNREDDKTSIADCERWRDRILGAIDQGFVMDRAGKRIPLDEKHGIDILGDIVESTQLSVNPQFYGSLHNQGHNLISFAHDPENHHLEEFGVMGDVTTAMRDPVFYRWHAFIDDIFAHHKSLLPAYNEKQLGFEGVTVDNVSAKINSKTAEPNSLVTYWTHSDIDLAAGLDFGPNGNIYASFIHLQHAPFEYIINVTNARSHPTKGTCRIFICPKSDEKDVLKLEAQRKLAIEMDKFTVDLNPGQNTIRRRSDQSSVTIPFERSFRRVGAEFQPKGGEELAKFQFCGCGWPQHMLLPKGKSEGMMLNLFVMISDYAEDSVEQTSTGGDTCADSYSFCGLKDKLYPDKRAMGYPFDRKLPGDSLPELTQSFPNMKATDIKIICSDRTL